MAAALPHAGLFHMLFNGYWTWALGLVRPVHRDGVFPVANIAHGVGLVLGMGLGAGAGGVTGRVRRWAAGAAMTEWDRRA